MAHSFRPSLLCIRAAENDPMGSSAEPGAEIDVRLPFGVCPCSCWNLSAVYQNRVISHIRPPARLHQDRQEPWEPNHHGQASSAGVPMESAGSGPDKQTGSGGLRSLVTRLSAHCR